MKRLLASLAVLLGLTVAALGQNRALPTPEIRGNNVVFGGVLDLGPRVGKKLDLSEMLVTPMQGGIARSLTDLFSTQVYAVNFGVIPGAADSGPALRAAFARAQQLGARLRLPAGDINVCTSATDSEALLRIERFMDLVGDSQKSRIVPCAAAGTRSVILIKPLANGGGIRGAVLRDFSIGSLSGTRSGGDGIRIDTTNLNGFVAKLLVENVSVADAGAGKWSLQHVNAYTPAGPGVSASGNFTGGLFASTFRDNDFFGGMKFTETGDSNNIERNVITGTNFGIDYQAISGAATARLVGNNITATGGAIVARNMQQIKIIENQLEQVSAPTGGLTNPAVIRLNNVADWVVRDNNINGYSYANIVTALGNTRGGRLGPNTVTYTSTHFLFHAAASPNNVVERQLVENIDGSDLTGRALVSVDAASPTFGVWQQLTLQNGWVAGSDASFKQGLWWMPLPDGTIHLSGVISGGTTAPGTAIATFPAGHRVIVKALRVPGLVFTGSAWNNGVYILDAAGNLTIQALPTLTSNAFLQFDGTDFNVRP